MTFTRAMGAFAALILAGLAFGDGFPDGLGIDAPSGSVVTTSITAGDVDDYVVRGWPGTTLTVVVRAAKKSPLDPLVEILRPNGTLVTAAEGLTVKGKPAAQTTKFKLDAPGIWKARVSGKNATLGPYSVSVTTTKPGKYATTLDAPDGNKQYRYTIPAAGGAKVSWVLKVTGAAPTFNSFLDPLGRPVAGVAGGLKPKPFTVPADLPIGTYTLAFDAAAGSTKAALTATVTPKAYKKRVAKMSASEPLFLANSLDPTAGGADVLVTVSVIGGLVDPLASKGTAGFFLGAVPFKDVAVSTDLQRISGKVPTGLAPGFYDVIATTTSGQPAIAPGAFQIVPPPLVTGIAPAVGPAFGTFDITITGRNFRPGYMGLLLDGVLLPVTPSFVDESTIRFTSPQHGAAPVTFRVRDLGAHQDSVGLVGFEFVATPAIGALNPPIVASIGGDLVTIDGANFAAGDRVYLETTTPNVFQELTATQTTFVDAQHHRFSAPGRPSGPYQVYVEDSLGNPQQRRTKILAYYSFADVTAASGLGGAADLWDGVSSALADYDGDGRADLVLSRRGTGAATTTSQTRVLRSDAVGHFTDVTASVMPTPTTDDWRAERVFAADVDADGRVDLVLVTNQNTVPAATRSHTRLLMNEARGGVGPTATERVFRDRTFELMPPLRTMTKAGTGQPDVSDEWRATDVWVGDLDGLATTRPQIVIVNDEVRQNVDVSCAPFCAGPGLGGYTFGYYWGGTREFSWDATANGGLGRFKYDHNFFPRKSGFRVVVTGQATCNSLYGPAATCAGKFTPFVGKRIAVADVDKDGKGDVAVVADHAVTVAGAQISSVQFALSRVAPSPNGNYGLDVTNKLTALGLDYKGDAIAFGVTGFPDANAYQTMAVVRAAPAGGASVLSLVRWDSAGGTANPLDISVQCLPAVDAQDQFQASQIAFSDVDLDGDQDVVLLANLPPGGVKAALRFLRNEKAGQQFGVFTRSLDQILPAVSGGEHFEGDALSIGDVTGDGLLDYVVTRATVSGVTTQTRIVTTSH